MSTNLAGIDVIMLHNAKIALRRLSLDYTPEKINWDSVKEFWEMFSKVRDDFDDPETKKFLLEVLRESHGNHPYRRRRDAADEALDMILDELELLTKERLSWGARAKPLYTFCRFFTKHIEKHIEEENSLLPTQNLQTASI